MLKIKIDSSLNNTSNNSSNNNSNNISNNNSNICNNCFKIGHQIHSCKLPIQSYGIIVFRFSEVGIQYLMIRRKDSFSYIDLIRGKYSPYNLEQIQHIIDDITLEEKERLINKNYEYLRNVLWLTDVLPANYKNEDILAQKKFDLISINNDINREKIDFLNENDKSNNNRISLKKLINKSKTNFIDQEWEFPKGRKNYNEKDIDCALREFEEETGFSKENIEILTNVVPYEEIFIGSNYKSYKHRYFVGFMKHHTNNLNNYQKMEVSKIEWKTINECLKSIRPNSIEKKNVIINVNKLLTTYNFYNNKM